MRKTILLMLLVAVSSSAAAEWVQVGGNEISTVYADPATILKTGNMVKMWDLADFKSVQARPYGTPYRSQKAQQEYDCKEQRTRIIDLLRYAENMGTGDVANTDSDPEKWEPVRPGTANAPLWDFACGTR